MAELGITSTTGASRQVISTAAATRCKEYAKVTLELAGVGEWTYDTLIRSKLNQGQWLVEWTPGHLSSRPDPGDDLRARPPGCRGGPRSSTATESRSPRRREIWRVGVTASEVRPRTYTLLTQLLHIDTDALRERVRAAEPDWFVPVIDLRTADYEPVRDDLLKVPGISDRHRQPRTGPDGRVGSGVLGTVGPATEDALEYAGPLTLPTDEVGLSGLAAAVSGAAGRHSGRHHRAGREGQRQDDQHTAGAQGRAGAAARDLARPRSAERRRERRWPAPPRPRRSWSSRPAPARCWPLPTRPGRRRSTPLSSAATHRDRRSRWSAPRPCWPRAWSRRVRRVECPNTTVVDGKQFKNYERGDRRPQPDVRAGLRGVVQHDVRQPCRRHHRQAAGRRGQAVRARRQVGPRPRRLQRIGACRQGPGHPRRRHDRPGQGAWPARWRWRWSRRPSTPASRGRRRCCPTRPPAPGCPSSTPYGCGSCRRMMRLVVDRGHRHGRQPVRAAPSTPRPGRPRSPTATRRRPTPG